MDENEKDDHLIASDLSKIDSFSAIGLLERDSDVEYIQECTELLMREKKEAPPADQISVVVFRLSGEWLALSTKVFVEIAHLRSVHKIPHKTDKILIGLVNLRGSLKVCLSLHRLLGIDEQKNPGSKQSLQVYSRLLAIQGHEAMLVFPVDEVSGVYRFSRQEIINLPVTVLKTRTNYFKGVIAWKDKSLGLLDEDLLIYSLQRSLQ